MDVRAWCKKKEDWLITLACLLLLGLLVALRYDYYYDLNDDVLMKDILAGVYTGTPESHNIQMLWPISGLVSLLYRVAENLPCYGLFLAGCQYLGIVLVIRRSLVFCRAWQGKVMLAVLETVLAGGLLITSLVAVQYTITCTMLASAAAFLFFTTDPRLPVWEFMKKNIGTVLLVVLAFLIRSEMLLLVMPLICAAGVIKWGNEEVVFTKTNAAKYLTVIGSILVGLLVSQSVHHIAYGSKEWQKFTEYFNNRTELYDFQVLPEYEPHQAFYESIGLTESERELLHNYNFGLDEEIDEKLVGQVAVYAAKNRSAQEPFSQKLKESLGSYYRRTFYGPSHNESDAPWNFVIIFSYLAVFVTAMLDRDKKLLKRAVEIFWKLGFLGMVRSVLWIWLILRDRVPVRISHSMYLMEFCILMGMLTVEMAGLVGKIQSRERDRRILPLLLGAAYLFLGAAILPQAVAKTDRDVALKAENNLRYEKLYGYLGAEENAGNFYFIDVYSSVAYTEKMFADVDNSLDNYDIMGGWACKSPLWEKKLGLFGIENMEEALIGREDVFYVQEAGADTDWLFAYYQDHGIELKMQEVETPVEEFEIYCLSDGGE